MLPFYVPVPPEIQDSLLIEEKSVAMGNTLTMECLTRGVPEPSIKWLREGVPFSFLTNPNLRVLEGGKRLQVGHRAIVHTLWGAIS